MEKVKIRKATINDLDEITEIETICFPPEEAATKESFKKRLEVYPDFFWLLEDEKTKKIISFVNGMASNNEKLEDIMFEDATLHNKNGDWQMIFGVNTLPEYRKQGFAGLLLQEIIKESKNQGKKGVVLTCKDKLVNYYSKFGFKNEGKSESTHGGAVWYDMRIIF